MGLRREMISLYEDPKMLLGFLILPIFLNLANWQILFRLIDEPNLLIENNFESLTMMFFNSLPLMIIFAILILVLTIYTFIIDPLLEKYIKKPKW